MAESLPVAGALVAYKQHEAGFFLPSDRANEYECASRSWMNMDYNDLHAKNVASFTEGAVKSTASGGKR